MKAVMLRDPCWHVLPSVTSRKAACQRSAQLVSGKPVARHRSVPRLDPLLPGFSKFESNHWQLIGCSGHVTFLGTLKALHSLIGGDL